ncbi:hypothetical protein L218DRAFT_947599 [Marasmius fiardii PR-910]|nr:hypothetical protein L218DRAFT_947599 [Marasmius fiardii PR-910]
MILRIQSTLISMFSTESRYLRPNRKDGKQQPRHEGCITGVVLAIRGVGLPEVYTKNGFLGRGLGELDLIVHPKYVNKQVAPHNYSILSTRLCRTMANFGITRRKESILEMLLRLSFTVGISVPGAQWEKIGEKGQSGKDSHEPRNLILLALFEAFSLAFILQIVYQLIASSTNGCRELPEAQYAKIWLAKRESLQMQFGDDMLFGRSPARCLTEDGKDIKLESGTRNLKSMGQDEKLKRKWEVIHPSRHHSYLLLHEAQKHVS